MGDLIKKATTAFMDTIETVVIALAIFVVIYLFLVQPHQVKGSSMVPNFLDGEYILTDKISYRFNKPQRGDVVVFKAPKDQEVDFIKRIIGLPGDTVELDNGKVSVNGENLAEKYLPDSFTTKPGAFLFNLTPVSVPEGQYFVLGDNRDHSSDSREWGFVTMEELVGKAWFIYWPVDKVGFVPKIKYSLISN